LKSERPENYTVMIREIPHSLTEKELKKKIKTMYPKSVKKIYRVPNIPEVIKLQQER
jgi:hypothetical protein